MKYKLLFLVAIVTITIGSFLFYATWFKTKLHPDLITVKIVDFEKLPGWSTSSNLTKSLSAFKTSCKVFLKQNPEQEVGSDYLPIKAKDWHPACLAALTLDNDESNANEAAQKFFQQWFVPLEFSSPKITSGLFTGYYSHILHGSLSKTEKYNVPIYSLPKDLIVVNLNKFFPEQKNKKIIGRATDNALVPYYTREEINKGAIEKQAQVLAWVDNDIDRSFLEIQGSGIVKLPNDKKLYLGYAGENGATYTSLAQLLIDKGVMTKDNASMQAIKSYLTMHPEEASIISNQNKSFVFFQTLAKDLALGSQGVALKPGYSLAIDTKWVPIGAPVWLATTRPDKNTDDNKPLQRLMIAQDTGGAIKGVIRGDVYWGVGKKATYIAGHMKNRGFYWVLLPSNILPKLNEAVINKPRIIN